MTVRRYAAIALGMTILVAGCGGDDSGATTPSEASATTEQVTTTIASTTTTEATTTSPSVVDPGGPFRDDFEGDIDPSWTWLNEDPGRWRVTDDGWLEVTADNPGLSGDSEEIPQTNVLIRLVPTETDFAVSTELIVDPDENFEQAGIVLISDGDSFVNLAVGFCGPCGPGRAVYLETPNDGVPVLEGVQALPIPEGITQFRLRLEHSPGNSATVALAAFGAEGTWERVGEIVRDFPPFESTAVGAANVPGPESNQDDLVALFDWFEIEVYG